MAFFLEALASRRITKVAAASLGMAALSFSSPSAQAVTYYWDNNGTTAGFGAAGGTWTDPTVNQWSTDATGVAAPGGSITTLAADVLHFGTATAGLSAGTITVSGTVTGASLTFGAASEAITFSGGTISTSAGTGLTNNSPSTHIFNSNITVAGAGTSQTWAIPAGGVTLNNPVSGTVSILKNGAGTLTVNADNSGYAGASIAIGGVTYPRVFRGDAGTLIVGHANALGGAGKVADVRTGVTLQAGTALTGANKLPNDFVLATGTVTFGGTNNIEVGGRFITSNNGSSLTIGITNTGTTTFSGPVSLSDVEADATQTLQVNVAPTAGTATISGAITNQVGGGASTNPHNLTVLGGGTLVLSGINTFTGQATVQSGSTVSVSSINQSLGSVSRITLGGASASGRLLYTGAGESTDRAVGSGAGVAGAAAIIENAGTGTLTFTGNTNFTNTVSMPLTLQGVSPGVFSGNIAGSQLSVVKAGANTWTLSGANSYSGATTVTSGVLAVTGSLGNTAVGVSGGTLSLENAGAISQNSLTVSGTGSLVQTVDDAISGTASLVIQNSNVTLSRPNSYSGGTTINSGTNTTLTITDPAAAGTGRFNAANGATNPIFALHINGGGNIMLANNFGGNSGITSTIDVGNNGSGTNGLIQLTGVGLYGNGTLNVTGSNGYNLAIAGFQNNAGSTGTTVLNPTTANLTLGTYSSGSNSPKTLQLDGTSTGNSITDLISNGTNIVSLTKANTSTWTISADGFYTGATTVTGGTLLVSGNLSGTTALAIDGGTFQLGASERVNDLAPVTLGGGTLHTGGFSETVGALSLTVSSTIDLGSGASVLRFDNSSATPWNGTLSITNWSGSAVDQVFFGFDASGLGANLASVQFVNPAGFAPGVYGAEIRDTGEVVAMIPEPSAAISLLGGVGVLLGLRRRRNA